MNIYNISAVLTVTNGKYVGRKLIRYSIHNGPSQTRAMLNNDHKQRVLMHGHQG